MKKIIISLLFVLFSIGLAIADEPKTLEDWKMMALEKEYQAYAAVADVRWLKREIEMYKSQLEKIRQEHKAMLTQKYKIVAEAYEKEYNKMKSEIKKQEGQK